MQRDNELRPARAQNHAVTIDDRRRILITDVEDVESFNETEIILLTGAGGMSITGEGLHISRLNLDEGQLVIEGLLSALSYEEIDTRSSGGFFARMFG